jgi:hypothetical protein
LNAGAYFLRLDFRNAKEELDTRLISASVSRHA